VIASDLRQRQRRRRVLEALLPDLFRAYRAPPDVVGVVLRFVGYDLPGSARPPDRDNRLEPFLQVTKEAPSADGTDAAVAETVSVVPEANAASNT
jgi:hypothetical protein